MYGVVTRNERELSWPEFDRGFYEVKDVTGRAAEPVGEAVNTVSCFADNGVEGVEDLVPVDDEGRRATRDRPYFDWTYVCPTAEDYRAGLLEIVADAADASRDVRLDDVGFPREEYCHCDRCESAFADSEYTDWGRWRDRVITEFVRAARERVPGDLYLTLYPDPFPGHLSARTGIDLETVADVVDEFVVPLYDLGYATTYWLEILASGFADRLGDPFSIELYAADVDVGDLVDATGVAAEYGNTIVYGYDASTARATIRRIRAQEGTGKHYGPE